jgi:N-acetylglucosamine-6-sulfatase
MRCKRRIVVAVVMAFCSLLAACTAPHTPAQRPAGGNKRPNIVFVLTDDLTTNLLRFMPQVRQMQRRGTSFARYFVVDSLCCPSRASIFTGKYPHDDGVFTNDPPDGGYQAYNQHDNAKDSFAVALQKSGYRTGFFGKYLNGYAVTAPNAPGWDEWHGVANGYAGYNYRVRDNSTITWHGHRPADYMTNVLGRKAATFLRSSAGSGQPFMMEVATFAPHLPATPAPRDARVLAGLRAPRPASFNRRVVNAPRWLAKIPAIGPRRLATINARYRQRARSVLAVNRMIGGLRAELQALGIADNTYVVFSSDNGFHMGEHRLASGKRTAFDTDIKVPLVVTGPGVPAGRTVTQMASSIDLCPTFEAIGKAKPGPRIDGVSLLPLLHGRHPRNWQRAVLIEHHRSAVPRGGDPDYQVKLAGDPPSYEAVRTPRTLYVQYADGEREYYNLRRDPAELVNLAKKLPAARLVPIRRKLTALKHCHSATACQRAAR